MGVGRGVPSFSWHQSDAMHPDHVAQFPCLQRQVGSRATEPPGACALLTRNADMRFEPHVSVGIIIAST